MWYRAKLLQQEKCLHNLLLQFIDICGISEPSNGSSLLLSQLVFNETKCLIVSRLKEYPEDQKTLKFIKHEGKYKIAKKSLDSFIGHASFFILVYYN